MNTLPRWAMLVFLAAAGLLYASHLERSPVYLNSDETMFAVQAQGDLELESALGLVPVGSEQLADAVEPLGDRVDVHVQLLAGAGRALPAGVVRRERGYQLGAPALVVVDERAELVTDELRDVALAAEHEPDEAELAGVRPPEGLDGQSFARQLAGQPAQPRKWVYSQLGRDYFVANHEYKLYGDGRLVDIRRSPAEEAAVSDGADDARAARESLQQALDQLRAVAGEDHQVEKKEQDQPRHRQPQRHRRDTPRESKRHQEKGDQAVERRGQRDRDRDAGSAPRAQHHRQDGPLERWHIEEHDHRGAGHHATDGCADGQPADPDGDAGS